jgi:hypothetical protein
MATTNRTATKAAAKEKTPTRSAFIREKLGAGMNAADIVAAAKAKGLAVTPGLVYVVKGRATRRKPAAKKTPGPRPKGKPAPRPRAGKMSASDFIRSMPATMTAKELGEAGKARGLKVSASLVYMVRGKLKRGAVVSAANGKRGPKVRAAVTSVGSGTGNVTAFKKMAFELGIPTAKQALAELERALDSLFG